MSVLAAAIVVAALLIAAGSLVAAVASWSDGRRLGRKPLIILVALAMGTIVQLPLPEGPDWRNVPMAFAIVLGRLN